MNAPSKMTMSLGQRLGAGWGEDRKRGAGSNDAADTALAARRPRKQR
jgi:hypothetical protein